MWWVASYCPLIQKCLKTAKNIEILNLAKKMKIEYKLGNGYYAIFESNNLEPKIVYRDKNIKRKIKAKLDA